MPHRHTHPEQSIENSSHYFELPEKIPAEKYEELIDRIVKEPQPTIYPAGETVSYIYDFHSNSFIWIEETIYSLIGLKAEEVVKMNNPHFTSLIIYNEHILSMRRFNQIFYDFIRKETNKDSLITFDLNIILKNKELKRVLFQFKIVLFDEKGIPAAAQGVMTDITHIKSHGAPQLIIMKDKKIVMVEKGTIEDALHFLSLNLSKKEIEILSLRGNGFQIKEIAEKLNLQKSTIFSYLRDIRRKSNMDIIPLIRLLSEKGMISCVLPIVNTLL